MFGECDDGVVLSAIFDGSADAIYTTTLDGIITSWNVRAEELYGFTSAEVMGRSILVVSPDQTEEEQHILRCARNGESIRDLDAVRVGRDGVRLSIGLTVVPLRAASGEIVGTLRMARDVSGRQHAERASRRLAAIVESSDDAIIGKDLDGIVTSWNRGAERMFGYSASEMIGESIRLLIPADRQNEEDKVLASIRSGEPVEHFETMRRHKNGTPVHISLTVSPIRDAGGRVVGASKIARDITERQAGEAERTRLLSIAEQNAAITGKLNEVGAVVASGLDRSKIVQAVIDAGTQMTSAEFGAFFYDVIGGQGEACAISGLPPGMFPIFTTPYRTAPFNATSGVPAIVRRDDITKDPAYGDNPSHYGMPSALPVSSYLAVPVRARSGEILGGLFFGHSAVGVFDEGDERLAIGVASWAAVALENARLYTEVEQASRLKDEFLATLSHELRTPLNAILGYARMIRDGVVTPERLPKAVTTIERNATSLNQIVEDVLDVSRIISGKLRLNVQPVEVQEVVRDALAAVTPAADAKGVRLESILDPRTETISGDPERLQQVVWNLLSNAVKFTGEGGRVQVRLERVASHVELVISDTGIGIAPQFLPHVFERFRQADSSITRERGGLGLGLGIARQLVEMHGGTIEAASDGPGLGATFRVRLPLMAMRSAAEDRVRTLFRTGQSPAATPMRNLSGVRVLVVDDDRDALHMVREILEATGALVSIADSAAAALETVGVVHPDVLVADLGMPRMDGFELLAQIRRHDDFGVRTVPAAALTAYARSEDRAKALRSGFEVHLSKPIDPSELVAAVALLARPRETTEPASSDRDSQRRQPA